MISQVLLTFVLIGGDIIIPIDGHNVRMCQYVAKGASNHELMITHVPASFKCERKIEFKKG